MNEAERTPRERAIEDRKALLDKREAVLHALRASLERVEDGHAAARAEAKQAREQARRIRLRSRRAREAVQQGGTVVAVPWRGRHPLGAEFAGLADRLLSNGDPHEAVRHVEAAASRLVPGAVVTSVMMLDGESRLHTPGHASALGVRLGEAQREAGEGPGEDATRPGGPKLARCDDLAGPDNPWPRFGPAAVGLGVRSVVAAGLLPLSPTRLGALHLYGRAPGALTDDDVDVAVALASYLALALVALTQVDQTQDQLGHLRQALDTRDVIGQAKGLVMAQRQVSADEAFTLLSAASQRLNIKLRDIAERVVRTRRL